jgi:hypothetical protein
MTTATARAVFSYDGTDFDLTVPQADVTGVIWRWTGEWNPAGEPLMRADDERHEAPVALPDVYYDHGPLIPVHIEVPAAARTAWLFGGAA